MNAASPSPEAGIPLLAPLVDVSDTVMRSLLAQGDSALARSIQRLVESLDDPDGVISAFQSYTSS
jgi:FXSXX-COOH protein